MDLQTFDLFANFSSIDNITANYVFFFFFLRNGSRHFYDTDSNLLKAANVRNAMVELSYILVNVTYFRQHNFKTYYHIVRVKGNSEHVLFFCVQELLIL